MLHLSLFLSRGLYEITHHQRSTAKLRLFRLISLSAAACPHSEPSLWTKHGATTERTAPQPAFYAISTAEAAAFEDLHIYENACRCVKYGITQIMVPWRRPGAMAGSLPHVSRNNSAFSRMSVCSGDAIFDQQASTVRRVPWHLLLRQCRRI